MLCLQVHFPNIICLTGVKIGAAPGTGSLTDVPHVHVFAHDLHTLSGSRYACVAEHCNLPDSGTRAVRVEVSTNSVTPFQTATWPVTEHILYAANLHQAVVTARPISDAPISGLWLGAASWFCHQGKSHCSSQASSTLPGSNDKFLTCFLLQSLHLPVIFCTAHALALTMHEHTCRTLQNSLMRQPIS